MIHITINVYTIYFQKFLAAYIAETVHPKIRTNMLVIPGFFLVLGSSFVWNIAYFLSWQHTAFVAIIPSALNFLIMFTLPESPFWLIEADKLDLAR